MTSDGTLTRLARVARRAQQTAGLVLCHGLPPRQAYVFHGGLGDQVLMTTVAHEVWQRTRRKVNLLSAHPALFAGNPAVATVWPPDPLVQWMIRSRGGDIRRVTYLPDEHLCRDENWRPTTPGRRHILSVTLQTAGVTGRVALRPYFYLTDSERRAGRVADRQICIQSSSLTAQSPIRTKQWFPDRFQQVVDALRGRANVVQIGSPADPLLTGVIDLRGRTDLRGLAAILANSELLIGLVSLPMHLARAVDCRAVIVYGGREGPEQSGYGCYENLFVEMQCSRCWLYDGCPHDLECMRQVTVDQVVAAADRQLARVGEPLMVDFDDIPPDRPVTEPPEAAAR